MLFLSRVGSILCRISLSCGALILLSSAPAPAGTPPIMNFQARFSDAQGRPIVDGQHEISFTVYDAAVGGQVIWTETQVVSTTDGVCAVLLGSLNPLNAEVFAGSPRFVGVQLAGEPEVSPRSEFATVAYAFQAGSAASAASTASEADTAWVAPYFRAIDQSGSLALTIISIYNADTSATMVTLSFYAENGTLIDECSQSVAAGAAWIFRSNQGACPGVTSHEGFVKVRADGPVAPSGIIMTAPLGSPTQSPASASINFIKL